VKAIVLCEGSDFDRLIWGDGAPPTSDIGEAVLRNPTYDAAFAAWCRSSCSHEYGFPPARHRAASANTVDGGWYRFLIGIFEQAVVDRLPLAFRAGRFDVDHE